MEDSEKFFRWSAERFYTTYRWQGTIDRRDAPRWHPDWISPDHLHAEIVGRVNAALQTVPDHERPAEWVTALKNALTQLMETGKALAAFFPGPFEDFQETSSPPVVPELFKRTNEKLEKALNFSEVVNFSAFAYSAVLPEASLAHVLRILNQPIDDPITKDGQNLTFLHLCGHIAGAARSEAVAAAVINRCLHAAQHAESGQQIAELYAIIVEACAAHRDPRKHREQLGSTAAQLCFAVKNSQHISHLEDPFDVIAVRDKRLIPAIARARAIARTRLKAL
jgi:hypothetical protein